MKTDTTIFQPNQFHSPALKMLSLLTLNLLAPTTVDARINP